MYHVIYHLITMLRWHRNVVTVLSLVFPIKCFKSKHSSLIMWTFILRMSLDRLDDNNFINKLLPYAALEALSGYHVFSLQRFLVVSVEVSLQRTRLRERLGTMPTFVRLLAGVSAHVSFKIGRARKSPQAFFTFVRLFAGVIAQMPLQIRRTNKRTGALCALVWTLAWKINIHMHDASYQAIILSYRRMVIKRIMRKIVWEYKYMYIRDLPVGRSGKIFTGKIFDKFFFLSNKLPKP